MTSICKRSNGLDLHWRGRSVENSSRRPWTRGHSYSFYGSAISKRVTEDFVDGIYEDHLQLVANFFRYVLEVALVSPRQNDGFDAGAARGQYLLLDSAH